MNKVSLRGIDHLRGLGTERVRVSPALQPYAWLLLLDWGSLKGFENFDPRAYYAHLAFGREEEIVAWCQEFACPPKECAP